MELVLHPQVHVLLQLRPLDMNLLFLLLWRGELPTAAAKLCLAGKLLLGWKILDLLNFPLEIGYEMIYGASPLLGHGHWHL